jgi:hypothetical protein
MIWIHEGPMYWKKWAHKGSWTEKRKDNHVSNNKLEREGSYLQNEYIYIMFHIYALLDIKVWRFSPWIQGLALQYMQGKHATSFILSKVPHKAIRSRMRRQFQKYVVMRNQTPYERYESTIWGTLSLSFKKYCKNLRYKTCAG